MKSFRMTYLAMGLVLLTLLSGCIAVAAGAAGAGAYVYISGSLERTYNAEIDDLYDASLSACRRLDLRVVDQSRNLTKGEIKAEDGDRSVWIVLKSSAPRVTNVSVRVGLMGDETASRRIHAKIEQSI